MFAKNITQEHILGFIFQALIYICRASCIFPPFPFKTSVCSSVLGPVRHVEENQTSNPLLASGSILPKKVVLGIIFKFFLSWLFTWLLPKCQPFLLNHFFNSCQLLEGMWEGAFNSTVTWTIPEDRQDQASIPQAFSMEWQLCCLGRLLRTEKKKVLELFPGTRKLSCQVLTELKTAFCRTRNHCLKIRCVAVGR